MMSQIYLKNKQKNLLNKKKEEQEEFSASTLFFFLTFMSVSVNGKC